jgi:dTMP kinase
MFICFEGIDGAGKSTQARKLFEHFERQGQPVELVADPGTTKIGKAIRQILLDTDEPISTAAQMLLFSAARAELSQYIQERLSAGVIVVCDRWILSTLVYQSELNGIDDNLIYDIFDKTAIRPDVCILLDIDPEKADDRKQHETRKDRYERVSLAEKKAMRAAYRDYAYRLADNDLTTLMSIIPAHDTPENVADQVLNVVVTPRKGIQCPLQLLKHQN